MNLIEVAKDIFIDPDEVVSVEHDLTYRIVGGSPSDPCMEKDFDGSRVTLKNGRKVFVNKVMPNLLLSRLQRKEKL